MFRYIKILNYVLLLVLAFQIFTTTALAEDSKMAVFNNELEKDNHSGNIKKNITGNVDSSPKACKELRLKMATFYKQLKTYEDKGRILRNGKIQANFETYYISNKGFKMVLSQGGKDFYVLWQQNDCFRDYLNFINELTRDCSAAPRDGWGLVDVLYLQSLVPALLFDQLTFPEEPSYKVRDTLVKEGYLNGHKAYEIKKVLADNSTSTTLVDFNDFHILKFEHIGKEGEKYSIDYDSINMGSQISETKIKFSPSFFVEYSFSRYPVVWLGCIIATLFGLIVLISVRCHLPLQYTYLFYGIFILQAALTIPAAFESERLIRYLTQGRYERALIYLLNPAREVILIPIFMYLAYRLIKKKAAKLQLRTFVISSFAGFIGAILLSGAFNHFAGYAFLFKSFLYSITCGYFGWSAKGDREAAMVGCIVMAIQFVIDFLFFYMGAFIIGFPL